MLLKLLVLRSKRFSLSNAVDWANAKVDVAQTASLWREIARRLRCNAMQFVTIPTLAGRCRCSFCITRCDTAMLYDVDVDVDADDDDDDDEEAADVFDDFVRRVGIDLFIVCRAV